MIYLTTGGNGAGKTLITLKDVRDQQLKEGRPVYFHGFKAKQQLLDWGWKEFDPKKWQDLPDGSVCVMDECQNEFPAKITAEMKKEYGELPDYINAVAQHRRRRGFDFWMITPHPSLIHVNIRRLIESPSWHRHLKRTFGGDMVSELRFNFADMKCEQPSAGKRGQVSMRAFPKEVYNWYESASLHTGKKKLPKQVWMILALAVVVPTLSYFAYKNVMGIEVKEQPKAKAVAGSVSSSVADQQAPASMRQPRMSVTEYLAVRTPRVPDFPHTAPAYDEVTKPVHAPFPAACIHAEARKTCQCYTQQGTVMQTSAETCIQIVKNGFFVDWQQQERQQVPQKMVKTDDAKNDAPRVVQASLPSRLEQPPANEWSQGLAARNAAVRSSMN